MTLKTYYRQSAMRWKCFTHTHSRINSVLAQRPQCAFGDRVPPFGPQGGDGQGGAIWTRGRWRRLGGGTTLSKSSQTVKQEEAGVADGGFRGSAWGS